MARLSMNEITTYRWTFDEDVRKYAGAGFDAIAVWRPKLSDFGEEKGAELLAECGLAVSTVLWAGGFTGSDGRTYEESVADALDAVHLAGSLKAASLVIYSGSRAGHTHNHARRLFRNALQELAPAASERGVSLVVEPMHAGCAGDWTFLTDLNATLDLIASVDCPQVRLAFDCYHLGQTPGIGDRLPEIVSRIGLVQLGDSKRSPSGEQNRCRLGDGGIPLREIVRSLLAGGYDGYFDVELMGEDLEDPDYDELLAESKRFFADAIGF